MLSKVNLVNKVQKLKGMEDCKFNQHGLHTDLCYIWCICSSNILANFTDLYRGGEVGFKKDVCTIQTMQEALPEPICNGIYSNHVPLHP